MKGLAFDVLQAEIGAVDCVRHIGRIAEITRGVLLITGLSGAASLGDIVEISGSGAVKCRGEVLQIGPDSVTVLADGGVDGLQIGDRAALLGGSDIAPHDSWIGRVIDPYGNAIDGSPLLRGPVSRALRAAPVASNDRRGLGPRMETGMAVFNTLLPIVCGQRIGLFAGSGVGKSTLMAKLAVGLHVEVVVIAMIGERSREVREFIERVLGEQGMKRAIIVAATSDQSPLARRRCAWAAMAVAEHFRDSGRQVLFMADSITRFAEAHREIALASGETGSLRGFPPSTAHLIASLCERAGPGAHTSGDMTAIFSVLVAGSDMEEPIADILRGVLDGHVILDREIAERGRFPAIDLLRSVSRALPECSSPRENAHIAAARILLGTYERNEMMIRAGLYSSGSDENIDAAITAWPKLDDFLSQDETVNSISSFQRLEACICPDLPKNPSPNQELPPTVGS